MYESFKERTISIGKYQFEIFKEVQNLRIKNVFFENLAYPILPEFPENLKRAVIDETLGENIYEKGKQLFIDGIPDKPSEEQYLFLGKYTCLPLIVLLMDDVNIYPTIDEKLKAALPIFTLMLGTGNMKPDELLKHMDQSIKKEMKKFFDSEIAKEAILILGVMHNFEDVCNRRFNPAIYSKTFFNSDIPSLLHSGPYEDTPFNFMHPVFKTRKHK